MIEKKLGIAYIRVSTEEQGEEDKYGVEVQKSAIENWAERNNYVITDYIIEKKSGAKERPLMNQIVFGEEVDNPPYQAVIVYKNDRIARDMKLYFYYEYVLNKRNIDLLCVQDEFLNGADSSVASLYKAMMQFVAEQERKNITMRTSSGRLAKAKRGGYSGGNIPYGYKVEDHKLVIQEEEANVVKMIFNCFEQTGKIMSAYKMLYSLNILGRNKKVITYHTVRSVLENKLFYEGLYHYSDVGYVLGQHQALLEMSNKTKEMIMKEEIRINDEMQKEMSGEIYG